MAVSIALVAVASLVLPNTSFANPPDSTGLRRWAIVASPAVQASGLADLLTAELSQLPDVELVERERFDAILKEQELATLSGATATRRRIKLGQLLSADGLLLLDYVPGTGVADTAESGEGESSKGKAPDDGKYLKLVISECQYGARVRVELLPLGNGSRAKKVPEKKAALPEGKPEAAEATKQQPTKLDPKSLIGKNAARVVKFDPQKRTEELVGHCVAAVLDARKRLSGGIEQIVGVTNLVSDNLGVEYDYLQSGYATLLQQSLIAQAGVAVLEIEEARAIARELDMAGRDLKRKPVTLFVTGEFEMKRKEADGPVVVRLSLIVSDGAKNETIEQTDVALDRVGELLASSITDKILAQVKSQRKSLPVKQQVEILTARATVFSELAAWEHSIPLWESAVLLVPEDVDLRIRLVRETEAFYGYGRHEIRKRGVGKQQHLERVRFLERHVYHLIYGRHVPPVTGAYLAGRLLDQIMAVSDKLGRSAEYQQQCQRVFRDLYCARIPKLDYDLPVKGKRQAREDQVRVWVNSGVRRAIGLGRENWDELFHFLDKVQPKDAPPNYEMNLIMFGSWRCGQHPEEGKWSTAGQLAFFEKLAQSEVRVNQLYGRFSVIGLRLCQGDEPTQEMLDEARKLVAEMKTLEIELYGQPSFWGGLSGYAEMNLGGLQYAVQNGKSETIYSADKRAKLEAAKNPKPKAKPRPIRQKQKSKTRPRGIDRYVETSRPVEFRPIDDRLRTNWNHWVKCGDSLDLMISPQEVFAMQSKGRVNSVFRADNTTGPIEDVRWSGKRVWIRTAQGGIHLCTLDGEELHRIGEREGFPQERKVIRQWTAMHPIDDERLLVFGSPNGKGRRAWLMVISPGEKTHEKRMRLILKLAKTIEPHHENQQDPAQSTWHMEFNDYDLPDAPDTRFVVAYRDAHNNRRARPILINCDTFEVSVLGGATLPRTNNVHDRRQYVLADGWNLAFVSGAPVRRKTNSRPIYSRTTLPFYQGSGMWEHGGWVYCFYGESASRHHIASGMLEKLVTQRPYKAYGRSAFYGLVAWNQGQQPYRLVMPPDDPLQSYDYMPEALRQRHYQAAVQLRKLGAKIRVVKTSDGRKGTCVELTGSDSQALVHLKELGELRELELAYTDLSGDGLRHVAPLKKLVHLGLYRTTATDADLHHILGLTKLEYLHLGSRRGEDQFGDAGLMKFGELKNLKTLALWGHRFTDASIDHLNRFPTLELLRLQDTSISKPALDKLKAARPEVEVRRKDGIILP